MFLLSLLSSSVAGITGMLSRCGNPLVCSFRLLIFLYLMVLKSFLKQHFKMLFNSCMPPGRNVFWPLGDQKIAYRDIKDINEIKVYFHNMSWSSLVYLKIKNSIWWYWSYLQVIRTTLVWCRHLVEKWCNHTFSAHRVKIKCQGKILVNSLVTTDLKNNFFIWLLATTKPISSFHFKM